MENQIVSAEGGGALVAAGMGRSAPVDPSDLLLPRILLTQQMSKLVIDERSKAGELRGSVDGNLLAEKGGELEVIPFHCWKSWGIFERAEGAPKWEWKREVPFDASNAYWDREWEAVVDGMPTKRTKALNYYVLLPSEIEAGFFFPYVLSFRSTSYVAGKKMESARAKLEMIFKKPMCFRTMKVMAAQRENELGKFYVFDVAPGRATSPKELEAVEMFAGIVGKSVKIDEPDHADAVESAGGAAVTDDRF